MYTKRYGKCVLRMVDVIDVISVIISNLSTDDISEGPSKCSKKYDSGITINENADGLVLRT